MASTPEELRADLLLVTDSLHDSTKAQGEMLAAVRALLEEVKNRGSTIQKVEVLTKTEGLSAWGAAAVTACFCTLIGLVLIAMELHDLRAWSDLYRTDIGKLKDRTTALEKAK